MSTVFVIRLSSGMYIEEIALDGCVSKTFTIDKAKKFDDPNKLRRYMDFLIEDGYSVDFEAI